MEVSKYEQTYACVKVAMDATKYVDKVVNFLRNASAPMSCKEIGTALFGDAYKRFPEKEVYDEGFRCIDYDKYHHNEKAQSLASSLGHVMSNLMRKGLIKLTKEKGEPFTIEKEHYVNVVDDEICETTIVVWDAKGNKYEIPNPNYRRGHGEYRKVPVTITPTIKKYSLV